MKLSQQNNYLYANDAVIELTKAFYQTGDSKIKEFRDELEKYLNDTHIIEKYKDEDLNNA